MRGSVSMRSKLLLTSSFHCIFSQNSVRGGRTRAVGLQGGDVERGVDRVRIRIASC